MPDALPNERTYADASADAPPVVVVGAGVAGLTAALALARAGRRVRVFEREAAVGGRVRSRHVDGYTVDRGFQVLFTGYPVLAAALGLRPGQRVDDGDDRDAHPLRLRRFLPAARLVTDRGASLVGDALGAPLRDPALLPATVAAGALSVSDKLRLLALRQFARGLTVEQCFADAYDAVPAREFLRARGFSERAVARFFAPFYGGVLLDPSLGTSAGVLLFTFKMLAEGDAAVPAGGMGDVPRHLARAVEAAQPGAVRTGAGVAAVLVDGGRAAGVALESGERVDAADVVLAAEAPAAARLAAGCGVALPVPNGTLGCTTIWFAAGGAGRGGAGGAVRQAPLPGRALWLNAAGHERAAAGGGLPAVSYVATMTEIAPEYAAPGAAHGPHLVAATALGASAELPDDVLVERMRTELAAMQAAAGVAPGGRAADAPALVPVAVERVPYGQFPQPPGSRARRTGAATPLPGLWRASETAHTSSLEGAARGGTLAAEAVLTQPAARPLAQRVR